MTLLLFLLLLCPFSIMNVVSFTLRTTTCFMVFMTVWSIHVQRWISKGQRDAHILTSLYVVHLMHFHSTVRFIHVFPQVTAGKL